MKVILKETIESLGTIGDEVTVSNGYARNYLLPQKKAALSTLQNRQIIEKAKDKLEQQLLKDKENANLIAEKIKDIECIIPAKVSDENRLYGSVAERDILKALENQKIDYIEKSMILLESPIKEIGTYEVPIKVYKGIKTQIIVKIVPE